MVADEAVHRKNAVHKERCAHERCVREERCNDMLCARMTPLTGLAAQTCTRMTGCTGIVLPAPLWAHLSNRDQLVRGSMDAPVQDSLDAVHNSL
jgi:hypothetical protein